MSENPIWPFEKQGTKLGYLNNPNFTPEVADPDVHNPCGYWPSNLVPSPGIPYEYWYDYQGPQAVVSIGNSVYFATPLGYRGLGADYGEEIRIIEYNLSTKLYTVIYKLSIPTDWLFAGFDIRTTCAIEVNGSAIFLFSSLNYNEVTYVDFYDIYTFKVTGQDVSYKRSSSEDFAGFPLTTIGMASDSIRYYDGKIQIVALGYTDAGTDNAVMFESSDFGATWTCYNWEELIYTPAYGSAMASNGAHIYSCITKWSNKAVSIYDSNGLVFSDIPNGEWRSWVNDLVWFSGKLFLMGLSGNNITLVSASDPTLSWAPQTIYNGSGTLDYHYGRFIVIDSVAYIFIFTEENGSYVILVFSSSDGITWNLDKTEADPAGSPRWGTLSLSHNGGKVYGTRVNFDTTRPGLRYQGVDLKVSHGVDFRLISFFEYDLVAKTFVYHQTPFVSHLYPILPNDVTSVPDSDQFFQDGVEVENPSPLWPLEEQQNKDTEHNGFWEKL